MDRVFVDTNIVLDLLAKREGFYRDASQLFSLADKQKLSLCVSSLTFANTHYLLARQLSPAAARKVLRDLNVLVLVLPLDDKVLKLALNSDFNDFEHAIQYFTAMEHNIPLILTRNLKDFKTSKIPVMTAADYLARLA